MGKPKWVTIGNVLAKVRECRECRNEYLIRAEGVREMVTVQKNGKRNEEVKVYNSKPRMW